MRLFCRSDNRNALLRQCVSLGVGLALIAALLLLPDSAEARRYRSTLSFSGSLNFVSDYIFRGVSRSNSQSTIQGDLGLNITVYGNLRFGLWGAGIAGGVSEMREYASYTLPLSGGALQFGVTKYTFPGLDSPTADETDNSNIPDAEFNEQWIGFSSTLARILTLGVVYYDTQTSNSDARASYSELHIRIPFGLWVRYGLEGSDVSHTEVGYSFKLNRLTLGFTYHDVESRTSSSEIGGIWSSLRTGNYPSEDVVFSITAGF